ncbi:hypothetical protein FHX81_7859 [Saccharothrix saharensis]|uniref:Uncharacterized protein n=1 Tax=Saccharothrix saharensis TaxID=571190 RepID=A0A543JRB1_9PSEU|nr:hypothetical protein FHX81_7859 [Saccharothrix saharensis]
MLEIQCRVHGIAHPATLRTRPDLASVEVVDGDRAAAHSLLRQVVPLGSPTLRSDHPMIQHCRLLLNALTSGPTSSRDGRRPGSDATSRGADAWRGPAAGEPRAVGGGRGRSRRHPDVEGRCRPHAIREDIRKVSSDFARSARHPAPTVVNRAESRK